jgi:hypothetical protein
MVPIKFDYFLWSAGQQVKKLETTARPIYHSAYKQLADAYGIAVKDARETEDLDEPDRSYHINWLKEEYQQQRVALAAMTFALLERTVNLYMRSMLSLVGNRSRLAPLPEKLHKIIAEYQSRFGLSVKELLHYGTVQEVVLARNCALHTEGRPSGDYLQQTRKRWLDEFGYLNLTPEWLDTLIEELKHFVTELGREMSQAAQRSKAN